MTRPLRGPQPVLLSDADAKRASTPVRFALDTIAETPGKLRTIKFDHRNEMASLSTTTKNDPHLTPEGRKARFAEVAAPVIARNSAAVASVREDAELAMRVLEGAVAGAQPARVAGVEGMLGRQAQWARVRELLAANLTMRQVIDEAVDPEQLHAIVDELPTWLRISYQGSSAEHGEVGAELYHLRVDRRIAELAGDTHAGADARAAIAARPDVVALPMLLEEARELTSGMSTASSSSLHVATASMVARQQAQAAVRAVTEGQIQPARRRG